MISLTMLKSFYAEFWFTLLMLYFSGLSVFFLGALVFHVYGWGLLSLIEHWFWTYFAFVSFPVYSIIYSVSVLVISLVYSLRKERAT